MGERKNGEVPARLKRLEQRFAAWRKTRVRGERIPELLWKSAAKLAVDYGLNQTSAVLKLDYYSLKKHAGGQATETESPSAFIELPSAAVAPASECVIEFEGAAGASLRVTLKGAGAPDVLALGRSFWDCNSWGGQ